MTEYTLTEQFMARNESIDIPNSIVGNILVENAGFLEKPTIYKISYLQLKRT